MFHYVQTAIIRLLQEAPFAAAVDKNKMKTTVPDVIPHWHRASSFVRNAAINVKIKTGKK
jgi:hypothetical protein